MPIRRPGAAEISTVVVLLLAAASTLHASEQTAEIPSPERTFIGPDGNPLPFKNDAEILDFLLNARVIEENPIGTGINRSRKMALEKDGVRANAIFRDADRTDPSASVGGELYRVFRDSYLFEPAAYQLALRIGITSIPPVIRRQLDRRDGSMQLWIEGVLDEEDKENFRPPTIAAWIRQLRDMILFDHLIYNVDRNGGNILVTSDYRLMMIDHTRAFQEKRDLLSPERLTLVNRDTWERFRSLSEEAIRDAVRPYLTPAEMGPLVSRHQVIIEHIESLIDQRGERAVVIP